jgi:large subunit ribosomal protein L21
MSSYAIIRCGGKQYRVDVGVQLTVDRLAGERGESIVFDQVLFLRDEAGVRIGLPSVEGVTVRGTIIEQRRDKKVRIFKYRRRKKSRRTIGHRQPITRVRIDEILA